MEARGRFLPRSQIRQHQHDLRDKLRAPSLFAGMPPLAPPQPMRQRPASGETTRDALAMPREGLSALLKAAALRKQPKGEALLLFNQLGFCRCTFSSPE